jgi:hypothetical protein
MLFDYVVRLRDNYLVQQENMIMFMLNVFVKIWNMVICMLLEDVPVDIWCKKNSCSIRINGVQFNFMFF